MIESIEQNKNQLKEALNEHYFDNNYPRQYLNIFGIRDESSPDEWNDVIGFFTIDGIFHAFEATTDPGRFYTLHPMNPGGAAWMCEGFHENLWRLGKHRGYPALVQNTEVRITRDLRKRYRPGNQIVAGYYGINHHRAHPVYEVASIGRYGAGCQVHRKPDDWDFAYGHYEKVNQPTYSYLLLNRQTVRELLGVEI